MRIKQLSPLVASQIAAGEVIERPASVLKELLENSIDANSTEIMVEVTQGGLKLLRIRDNGLGIWQDDLALAVLQHTTSKISSVADLLTIKSLGFRGEALASIAAVSQVEIVSKPKQQELAWQLKVTENIEQPATHIDGTTITVKNLFYNVPARRKFLRSEHSEFLAIEEVFKRIALSNFAIAFTLIKDGKKLKYLPSCDNELAKAKRLSMLCGNRMLAKSSYVTAAQNGLELHGWLGMPEDARSNSSNQFFYINNRMVKDKLINHAIKQAYQAYCPAGKYPTYCLYFTLEEAALDVNVHPTKHEVRFRDPRVVHAFLVQIIIAALEQAITKDTIVKPVISQASRVNQDFLLEPIIGQDTMINSAIRQDNIEKVITRPLKMATNNLGATSQFVVTEPKEIMQQDLVNTKSVKLDLKESIKILCILGNNKLIFAEQNTQIFLIDVKASKEQLLTIALENLFIKHGYLPKQTLVIPKTIEITHGELIEDLLCYQELFAALGFSLDQIGATNILLRSVPAPLVGISCDFAALLLKLSKLFQEFRLKTPAKVGIALLNNILFSKIIKLILKQVIYQEQLNNKEALQLVQEILSLPIASSNKATFKQINIATLSALISQ